MKNKNISIGIDDFKKLIDKNNYYVDKTLLIKEIIDLDAEVTLITRPRRFGKTLNMSMLRYFFEKFEDDKSYLFEDLLITKEENSKYIEEQGRYPVIYITLKGAKKGTWEETLESLKKIIADEFEKHSYLLDSEIFNNVLGEFKTKKYMDILNLKATENDYTDALKDLSKYLKQYHGESCIILIDEYDTPLQKGYLDGYFDEVLEFMKSFLGESLKGNPSLKRGVLTGIMKIAKESIFSDFNNPTVATVLSHGFKDKFGFTEEEVNELIEYYDIGGESKEIKNWYNGYVYGRDEVIYNPWSILNYTLYPSQGLIPYWINTGDKELIKRVLQLDKSESKKTLEDLLGDKIVKKNLLSNIVYQNIETNIDIAWSFLVHAGYLKAEENRKGNEILNHVISIPNKEVRSEYENMIKEYFKEDIEISPQINGFINALLDGEKDKFSRVLKSLYLSHVSYYDVSILDKFKDIEEIDQDIRYENFHHGFILGLLMYANNKYDIYSNREYGLGRPDIVLVSKDKKDNSYVFEFKWSSTQDKKTLEILLENAKTQIKEKKYVEGVKSVHNIDNVVTIAVGFKGKDVDIDIE